MSSYIVQEHFVHSLHAACILLHTFTSQQMYLKVTNVIEILPTKVEHQPSDFTVSMSADVA